MLPTFVIGLREGLEAALIVGIIAAFLRKQGRRDLLRWVFVGVGAAVGLCLAVGVALDLVSQNLPPRQQEGLETVIGVFAVAMVTYMVVWMKRHSRELKGQLEGLAAEALASGGAGPSRAGRAMVAMAFLAVLREGFETVVFLLAAFNEPGSSLTAAIGALLGIAVAVGLGYGIYRGGVRINLSKFFRATGLVLVLVAAGLVVNALHTAHEAGWLNAGQARVLDLTALVRPGSVQSSLLTGMLGVQQHPVVIEVIGWLVYLIPVALFVAWPPGRGPSRAAWRRSLAGLGAAAAVATVVLALVAPGRPAADPVSSFAPTTAQLRSAAGPTAVVRTAVLSPVAGGVAGAPRELTLHLDGADSVRQVRVQVYRGTVPGRGGQGQPARLSYAELAARNGGRLPIGLVPAAGTAPASGTVAMHYRSAARLSVWVEPRTGRVLDLRWSETVTGSAAGPDGTPLPLSRPVARASWRAPAGGVSDAARQARAELGRLARRSAITAAAWGCGVTAVLALLVAGALAAAERRRGGADGTDGAPEPARAPAAVPSKT
jgi:high-affinity iron transporter